MTVEEVTEVTPDLVEAFENLIPQLSAKAKPMKKKAIKKYLEQPNVYHFIYRAVPTGESPLPGLDPILGILFSKAYLEKVGITFSNSHIDGYRAINYPFVGIFPSNRDKNDGFIPILVR